MKRHISYVLAWHRSGRLSDGGHLFASVALGGLLALTGAACGATREEGVAEGAALGVAEAWQAPTRADLQSMAQWNDLATAFYDPGNVVQIDITMDPDQWRELQESTPHGGVGNAAFVGDRYDWYDAAEVTVRGSAYGNDPVVVSTAVQVKKRGWYSSWNTGRPSLKIKFKESGADAVKDKIGTRYISLNNNWDGELPPPYPFQDPYFLKTCLGYRLFKEAGLPYSRCNFAILRVNGESPVFGPYINVEPIEELHAYNNFDQNTLGNLYEFEIGEDFDLAMKDRTDFKGLSAYSDKKDFELAATEIAAGNMKRVVDVDQFIKYYAMEILLQHQDSYSGNQNNVFVYNDVQAVADPDPAAGQVKFKFIPWGIDRILGESQGIFKESLLAKEVAADPVLAAQVRSQIYAYLDSVFSPAKLDAVFVPYVRTLRTAFESILPDYPPLADPDYLVDLLKQRRAYIDGLFGHTALCDEKTATDLGAAGNEVTVPTDGCVKVQDNYPKNWGINRTMKVDSLRGTYDVPFTWSNGCSGGSGSETFTADWQSQYLRSIDSACATVIDLQGAPDGRITLRYWAN